VPGLPPQRHRSSETEVSQIKQRQVSTLGKIAVAADAVDDRALERWIGRARGHAAGLPPK
jgi:hypothetical protein